MPECRKTVTKLWIVACCLLIAATLASCGSMGSGGSKGKEGLATSVETFNRSFKWEDYNAAAIFIGFGQKEQFWRDVDRFKGKIRITDFQIREIDHVEKSTTGTAILCMQYYSTSSPTLESVTFSQSWYFSEKDKGWLVKDPGFQAIPKK
ncbi:MAG: hypothetical protein ABFD97_12215 [Syntrophobacter sp.]